MLVGLITMSRAEAAGLGIRVVDEFGKPLSGAAVCLGTTGKTDQFGAYLTSAKGDIMVADLPKVAISITVSKDKYQGVHFVEPIRNWNLIKQVTLLLDGEGPVCKNDANVSTDTVDQGLVIAKLQATQRGAYTLINSEISGSPTHYRVSDRQDFKGSKWRPYNKQVKFRSAEQGELFFQVKRYSGKKNRWLEARSQIVNTPIN